MSRIIHFTGLNGEGVRKVFTFFALLKQKGYIKDIALDGCDIRALAPSLTKKYSNVLRRFYLNNSATHITDETVGVIASSAILKNPEHAEINRAKELRVPILEFTDVLRYVRDRILTNSSPLLEEYYNRKSIYVLDSLFAGIPHSVIRETIHEAGLFPLLELSEWLQTIKTVAVTGTDGKTTTVFKLFNSLREMGYRVAMFSTVGAWVYTPEKGVIKFKTSGHTTPPEWELAELLSRIRAESDPTVIIFEISAHAVAQLRIVGVSFDVVLYTTITQDHLAYFKTREKYEFYKSLLSLKYLKPGGDIIANYNSPGVKRILKKHIMRGAKYGRIHLLVKDTSKYRKLRILDRRLSEWIYKQRMSSNGIPSVTVEWTEDNRYIVCADFGSNSLYDIIFPENVLLSLIGWSLITGKSRSLKRVPVAVVKALFGDKRPPGRLEVVSRKPWVIVDYAHTVDAMRKFSRLIRKFKTTVGARSVISVFGVAGNHFKEKRGKLGKLVAEFSDRVILVPQDSKLESTASINDDIMSGLSERELVYKLKIAGIPIRVFRYGRDSKIIVSIDGGESFGRLLGFVLALNSADKEDIVVSYKGDEHRIVFSKKTYPWHDGKVWKFLLGLQGNKTD